MLIVKEWLEFGHKFADRCGNGKGDLDTNEYSPIFLQWLDSVYQLTVQFPTAFEFNEAFLVSCVTSLYDNEPNYLNDIHIYGNVFQTRMLGP